MMWWIAACSDYGLGNQQDAAEVGRGDIAADPGSLALGPVCGTDAASVLVENVGSGPLVVNSIEVTGEGWSLGDLPELPLTLDAGEGTLVPLSSAGGDAELVVGSDDADTPTLTIPLSAAANEAPVVRITAPTPGEVWPEGAEVTLTGTVSDDADAAEALTLAWSSSDRVLSTGAAAADGTTNFPWPAAERPTGHHILTLAATDSCGATGTATVEVCQDGAYTFDALDLATWHYEGVASYDSANTWLELTPAAQGVVGSAFEASSPVNADSVDIEFTFFIGGGTGADGLSLTALDVGRMTSWLGGTGCGIGYGGSASCTDGPALPGWSIEIDTYQNGESGDPAEDHLAFTFDGDVDAPAALVTLPEMEDSGWHTMWVSVAAPHVTVAIDATTYIDADLSGNFAFSAFVGFTAGTGNLTNQHVIDSLTVTDYSCD